MALQRHCCEVFAHVGFIVANVTIVPLLQNVTRRWFTSTQAWVQAIARSMAVMLVWMKP